MQHKDSRAELCELETPMLRAPSQLLTLPQWCVPEKDPKNTFGSCLLEADKGNRFLTLCSDDATAKFTWGFPSRRICSPPAHLTNSSMSPSLARAAPAAPNHLPNLISHSSSFTRALGLHPCLDWGG